MHCWKLRLVRVNCDTGAKVEEGEIRKPGSKRERDGLDRRKGLK